MIKPTYPHIRNTTRRTTEAELRYTIAGKTTHEIRNFTGYGAIFLFATFAEIEEMNGIFGGANGFKS